MLLADFAREQATGWVANRQFNRAVLTFQDSSYLQFEHSSRSNRWAKASNSGTTADRVCLALAQFRLNAKHLELFFEDGSQAEFHPADAHVNKEGGLTDGTSLR